MGYIILDKINFTTYFLIRNLESFLRKINGKTDNEKIKKLYTVLRFGEEFEIKKDRIEVMSSIIFGNNNDYILLEYLNIFKLSCLSLWSVHKEQEKRIDSFIRNAEYHTVSGPKKVVVIDYSEIWSTEVEDLFNETGLTKNLIEYIKEIKVKVKQLKKEVNEENKNNLNLLDIR